MNEIPLDGIESFFHADTYQALPCFGAVLNDRAYIDGRSRLIIQGSHVWWHHLECAAPGRHGGADHPTYLNSAAWLPAWPSAGENSFCNCPSSQYTDLSPELAKNGSDIEITEISVRDDVFVYRQPSGANEYTAIVEFYEGNGGAAWYEINITYSGKDQASIPTLSDGG
ncbi:MAG: hypothetical protein MUE70_13735 [Desulfobacterales bacterium]|nr:hypothetical protein [Desulfobacterales bacterium]